MGNKPTIGLALGSGAARGLAHIGVLMALEEHGIEVDMIAGCSAGALVGAMYLLGISPKRIAGIARQMDMKIWVDLTIPRRGFIKGEKIEEIMKILSKSKNIEDLSKPFIAVSTDLKTSKRHLFTEGSISKAVRSSISIPGVFEPVRLNGKILVDGAVIDRVPSSVVKEMGAEFVIAVDVGFGNPQGRINHIFDVILQSIDVMAKQISKRSIIQSDVLIEPPLSHIGGAKFNLVDECVEIGYNSTIEKIESIKELIGQRGKAI